MIHLGDETGEHLLRLLPFAVQVVHDPPFAFGQHDVNRHGLILAESPAATDRLVILLKAVGRKIGDMAAALEVQSPGADLWLGDQHSRAALGEVNQATLFHFVAIRSRYLDGAWNELLQQVSFLVEVAPDQRRSAG